MEFGLDDAPGPASGIADGADHLWGTAQRVGIQPGAVFCQTFGVQAETPLRQKRPNNTVRSLDGGEQAFGRPGLTVMRSKLRKGRMPSLGSSAQCFGHASCQDCRPFKRALQPLAA